MRLLILSNGPTDARRRAFDALAGEESSVVIVPGTTLPDLAGSDALVVDGAPPSLDASDLRRVEAYVEAGGALISLDPPADLGAFWTEILGVQPGAASAPAGEYFAKIEDGALGARLDREFPLVGALRPLSIPNVSGATVVAAVSIGFVDHALVTQRRVGAGRALACAVAADSVPGPLSTLLRRAITGSPASPRSLGIAIVGYGPFGGMGYYHGLGIAQTSGLELVAVVDPSDERRKAAEHDFAGLSAYASVDDLVGDADVDVAIVATPPSAHFGLARQLLSAGKHVACEKPLCLTAAQADELIALSTANERMLTVHQNRRWDPDFLAVRRAVDAGLLGDLFNVETFVGGFEHPCRAWHSDVAVSGGAVYDWGSHHVDWILQLLGSAPARVTTHGHKRVWHDVTNLDQLRLHLSWDDGREAEFFQSDIAGVRRPKFFVQGTAGTLAGHYRPLAFERIEPGRGFVTDRPHHAEAPAELTLARYESGYGLTETSLPLAPEQRFGFHRNLGDHLLLGEPLAVTAASVRSVVAVLEASQRSSDEGGRVIELET